MIHARPDYQRIQDPAGLIPEDEPVFLLRAQDVAAPMTVKWWAATHDAHGGDPRLSYLAKQWAERMEQWQAEHGSKRADLPMPGGPQPQAEPVADYDAEQLRCACLDGLRLLEPGMPGYAIARSTLAMLDDLAAANARVAVLESELARAAGPGE